MLKKHARTLLLPFFYLPLSCFAGHTIYSPHVEEGENEIELTTDFIRDGDNHNEAYYLEFAKAVTSNWKAELITVSETDNENINRLTEVGIENIVMLSEPGEYFLDFGALIELIKSQQDDSPNEIEAGLLLQKDFSNWTWITNLLVEKEVGNNAEGKIEAGLSMQAKLRLKPAYNPSIQLFSNEYETLIGPAIEGYTPINQNKQKWGYSLAALAGVTDASPKLTLRAKVEFEFY